MINRSPGTPAKARASRCGRLHEAPAFAGERVAAALRAAVARLAGVSDSARLDAELLMAHALGVEREALLIDPERFAVPGSFDALVERRLAREPVAYIVGYRDFWSLRLAVGPGALIPRPDSETLIEACLDFARQERQRGWPSSILDLGTGPGTLLLAALGEFAGATGIGVDCSPAALAYAGENAVALGLAARARFQTGDWTDGLTGRFDLILCNPPYVETGAALMPDVAEHEPAGALFAGPEGLDDYRRIIPVLPALLAPGGLAVLEIGSGQRASVTAIAEAQGLRVTCRQDLAGHDRALLLQTAG